MSTEGTDPRLEALLREAYAREDVYRFRQVLREVATEVEARQGAEETPVIPLWRRPALRWMAAAAVLALAVLSVYRPTTNSWSEYALNEVAGPSHRSGPALDLVDSLHAGLTARFGADPLGSTWNADLMDRMDQSLQDPAYAARYGAETRLMMVRMHLYQGDCEAARDAAMTMVQQQSASHAARYYGAVAELCLGEKNAARQLLQGDPLGQEDDLFRDLLERTE